MSQVTTVKWLFRFQIKHQANDSASDKKSQGGAVKEIYICFMSSD